MRGKDPTRWVDNGDGTFSRRLEPVGENEVEAEAEPEPEPEAEPEAVEPEAEAEAEVDYEEWTKVEIQDELESRGLPTTGNKPELIVRLQEGGS